MLESPPAQIHSPPSRGLNPFATCWTRPGARPFRFSNGQSIKQLLARLADQKWYGAITGPHGSGKSTLLESLKPAIIATGRCVQALSLHDGQRRLPPDFFKLTTEATNTLLIIDGYEQLGWPARLRLWQHSRSTAAGLVVTSHTPVSIPTLIHLSPDRRLVDQLVADL